MHNYESTSIPTIAQVGIKTSTFAYLKLWTNYNAYFYLLWCKITHKSWVEWYLEWSPIRVILNAVAWNGDMCISPNQPERTKSTNRNHFFCLWLTPTFQGFSNFLPLQCSMSWRQSSNVEEKKNLSLIKWNVKPLNMRGSNFFLCSNLLLPLWT